jgi:hypothetical protein
VGGEEVVLGREHLLVGAHPQPAVQQAQAERGAVGEGDLGRLGTEVPGRGHPHRVLGLRLGGGHVGAGVGVEPGAVAFDGLGHRPGMGGQDPRAEVGDAGVERELVPHRGPVGRVERRRGGRLVRAARARRGAQGGDRRAGEERAAGQRGHPP